jgi:hypothetical protein
MRHSFLPVMLASAMALSAQDWPRNMRSGNQLIDMGPLDAAHVKGTVVDPTGAAIAGARVQVELRGSEELLQDTESDNQGHFRLRRLRPGNYWLGISAPGFNLNYRELKIAHGAGTKTLQVKLRVGT